MGRRKKSEISEIRTDAGLEAEIISNEKPGGQVDEKERKSQRRTKLDNLFSDEVIGELIGYPFEILAENFGDERFKLKEAQKQMLGFLIDATAQKADFRPSEYPHIFLLLFFAYVGFEKFWIYKKYHGDIKSSAADHGEVGQRQDNFL